MRNKLIAAGAGLFGYGVLIGWAITGDLVEKRMKEVNQTLTDLNERQSEKIEQMQLLLESIPMTEYELDVLEKSMQKMAKEEFDPTEPVASTSEARAAVGTTPDGRTAYSEADEVVERPMNHISRQERADVPDGETPEETTKNLRGIIQRYVANEDEVHDFESMVLANADADKTPPYIISQDEFAIEDVEGEKYDKATVTYYPRERVVLDEEDQEPLDDVNSTLGWENMNSFGHQSGNADVVFIRNRRLQIDYEVVHADKHESPPLHVIYGMPREQFNVQKAAGTIKFREGDE